MVDAAVQDPAVQAEDVLTPDHGDVAIDGESAREVTRWGFEGRLRSLAEGPDGAIWVAEDGKGGTGGRVLKLTAR